MDIPTREYPVDVADSLNISYVIIQQIATYSRKKLKIYWLPQLILCCLLYYSVFSKKQHKAVPFYKSSSGYLFRTALTTFTI